MNANCLKSQAEKGFLSEIGVCTRLENVPLLKKHGYNYFEASVGPFTKPGKPESDFLAHLETLKQINMHLPAFRSFLPGSLKTIGEQVDVDKILAYSEIVFKRVQISGAKTIVFGSGDSRKIPDGFEKSKATAQFVDLLKRMGPLAAKYDIVIAVEHLNSGETNFINTLAEGLEIARQANHPNIQVLLDVYHMMRENDPPEVILKAGSMVNHTHIAEKEERMWPGKRQQDFRPYLEAIRKINYKGRMSLECGWENMDEQLPIALDFLRKQIADVA